MSFITDPTIPPQLTSGDGCSVAPVPAPCLNFIQDVAAAQPDNTALWGIFLIGLAAGFALAFVLTAPAAYKLGKQEGRASVVGRNIQHAYRGREYRDGFEDGRRRGHNEGIIDERGRA